MFGAYFPDWLIFAVFVLAVAIAARILFSILGKWEFVPFPLFTCIAIGILVAGLVNLFWLDW